MFRWWSIFLTNPVHLTCPLMWTCYQLRQIFAFCFFKFYFYIYFFSRLEMGYNYLTPQLYIWLHFNTTVIYGKHHSYFKDLYIKISGNYLIHVLNLPLPFCQGRSKGSTEEYVNPTGAGPQKIQHVVASVGLLIVNCLVNCVDQAPGKHQPN